MAETKPVPASARLFKILCCPLNTKTGYCIAESLYKPYVDNDTDINVIIGNMSIIQAAKSMVVMLMCIVLPEK